jgi:hypothetical protein
MLSGDSQFLGAKHLHRLKVSWEIPSHMTMTDAVLIHELFRFREGT